jgi:hypothetical protein
MGPSQDTSIRQDVTMINAILALCASRKVTGPSIPIFLTPTHGHILDGHPIASDPATYEEKLRTRHFGRYCEEARDFVVGTRFCQLVRETRETGAGPREVQFLRLTRLGRMYAGMPPWLQMPTVSLLAKMLWILELVRSYKWMGLTIAAATVAIGWLAQHAFTGRLVALAAALGLLAMVVANWLHTEEPPSESPSPDDTLW